MNEEQEKHDKKNFSREMSGNNGKKKNRHPELARYQPPNSRNPSNQNQILQKINKEKQNVELTREKSPSKPIEKKNNNSGGGLIKLDQKAIDKIINKSEIRTSNDNRQVLNEENTDPERHLIIKSDRSKTNESRTLFNPENPDKPILVDLKSRQMLALKSSTKKTNILDNKK